MKIGYESRNIGIEEVVISITEKCNNNCLNCPNDTGFDKRIIEPSEVINFIDKHLNADVKRITLIGGEPTISKDFFKIVEHIINKNPKTIIQINSNGRFFFYEEFTKNLARYNANRFDIHIALYGSNSEIHEQHTQVRGSFKQTIEGIKNLQKYGFKIQLRTIITKLNYKDLPDLANLIKSLKIGYKLNFIGMDIIGKAYQNKEIIAVSHLEIAPFVEKAIDNICSNINCEIHLLPKGIFKFKYHKYARMSGCVDGAFTDSQGCNECSYIKECPRLLKSYVSIFGNKEHLPCIVR